ncbi:hypothetical protein PENANT_c274G02064 [Penicillium antarcticum]|uniref:Uncharacterized protein n=1 Tax=Penicillium antarcticum TaxID=416450 RepID=A0A1V6NZH3_9EURO|nr:hypothetical protein PENANT_c274G02064 [Penicillium antarcticum]
MSIRPASSRFAHFAVPKLQTSTTSTVATIATASSVENAIVLNSIQTDPIDTEDTFPLDIDLLDITLFDGAPYLSLLTGIAYNKDDLDIVDEDNDQVPSSLPSSLPGTPPMMSAYQEVVKVLAVLQDNDTSGLLDPEAALEKS